MEIVDKVSAELSRKINAEAKQAFRETFGEKIDSHVGEITRGVFTVLSEGVVLQEQYSWRNKVFLTARVRVQKNAKGGIEFILQLTKYNKTKHYGNH